METPTKIHTWWSAPCFSQCPFINYMTVHFMHWVILTRLHSCIFQPTCFCIWISTILKTKSKYIWNENYIWDWPNLTVCTSNPPLCREGGWTKVPRHFRVLNMELDEILRLREKKKIEDMSGHNEVLVFTLSVSKMWWFLTFYLCYFTWGIPQSSTRILCAKGGGREGLSSVTQFAS